MWGKAAIAAALFAATATVALAASGHVRAPQKLLLLGGKTSAIAPPPAGCTPLGLKFNVACNSQYIAIVH